MNNLHIDRKPTVTAARLIPSRRGSTVAPGTSFLRGRLRNRLAVFSRGRGSVVHSARNIALHGLSAAHDGGVRTVKFDLMAGHGKIVTTSERDAILQIHSAARKSYLPESCSLHPFLNVHPEIPH